jgi:DNA polymerase-4
MVIMHIDANSAYLAWTAVDLLEKGAQVDVRTIAAVIAGDPKSRHGIILAKSGPCKKAGIVTGESLFEARRKCPDLVVLPPNYDLYLSCSNAMFQLLSEYSPIIQRYSIDECFLDYTRSAARFGDPIATAREIGQRMKRELGFTVNIGIGPNPLLAKMASELEKPDRIHTLWPDEIKEKMWKLPIRELFMVGRATETKLRRININTIGDLAQSDPEHMKALLKSHGQLIWEYANGIDDSTVTPNEEIQQKGLGNGTTTAHDVKEANEAKQILLALTERVAMRLRRLERKTCLVSVSLKTDQFLRYSHQVKLSRPIDGTTEIFGHISRLFDQCWRGEPLRYLGVSLSEFESEGPCQISIFDEPADAKGEGLDQTIDAIRKKYGDRSILRATFANGRMDPLQGGVNDGDYIMMGGYGRESSGGTD